MAEGQGERRPVRSGLSDWMSRLPDQLHTVQLWSLAIPGSHDAMTYDLDINSSIMEPDQLIRFSGYPYVRHKVYNWAVTQEMTITEQLDAGVRYFDLRIARKPDDSDPTRLYFSHGLYTRTDVETVLTEINTWAEGHPQEVLILSLSHFNGVDKSVEKRIHGHLINFIKTLFGAKLFPRTDTPTLKSCWELGRNVIVSYDHPERPPEMWLRIPYYYGESMDPTKIKSKLDQDLAKRSNSFAVYGLNLTLPEDYRTGIKIFFSCDTLANVIERSLPSMLEWVKKQTPGDGEKRVNIIASDLVDRHDFVSTVIKLNDKLLLT